MATSDSRLEAEIQPFRACAMHPAIIIGTVRSLWTWLWGRCHIPQNVFLVKEGFHKDTSLHSENRKMDSHKQICAQMHVTTWTS